MSGSKGRVRLPNTSYYRRKLASDITQYSLEETAMSVQWDGSALRLRIMEESHDARREAKDEASDLRGRSLELKRTQVKVETEADREAIDSRGDKSLAQVGGSFLRFIGIVFSYYTYGISAAVGEIAAQGVSYGTQKDYEARDLQAAAQRREGAVIGVQAVSIDARVERLEEAAEGERRLARNLASAQERIQRDMRPNWG